MVRRTRAGWRPPRTTSRKAAIFAVYQAFCPCRGSAKSPEPLKQGAKELVSALRERGFKVALATASPRQNVERALSGSGLIEKFDAVSVSMVKDEPESYAAVAKTLGVAPCECIVAEDQMRCVMSARAAGMKTLGVYDRVSVKFCGVIRDLCDLYFEDLTDTKGIIKEIEKL